MVIEELTEIVEMINQGKSQRKVAAEVGISESTLRSKIKEAGFVRDEQNHYVLKPRSVDRAEPSESAEPEKNVSSAKLQDWIANGPKEEKPKKKKRASFDIDEDVLKQLKIFAILNDKNIYEVAETAIRKYLRD